RGVVSQGMILAASDAEVLSLEGFDRDMPPAARVRRENLCHRGPRCLVGLSMVKDIPTVVEQTHRGERGWDIFSRLLKDRIGFLRTEVADTWADSIIARRLFLESADPDKDVMLYINSPGGSVTAGLGIYDTMQYVRC